MFEPRALRYERTSYGKEIRKQYEKGEIKEKIGNMRELQLDLTSYATLLLAYLKIIQY